MLSTPLRVAYGFIISVQARTWDAEMIFAYLCMSRMCIYMYYFKPYHPLSNWRKLYLIGQTWFYNLCLGRKQYTIFHTSPIVLLLKVLLISKFYCSIWYTSCHPLSFLPKLSMLESFETIWIFKLFSEDAIPALTRLHTRAQE